MKKYRVIEGSGGYGTFVNAASAQDAVDKVRNPEVTVEDKAFEQVFGSFQRPPVTRVYEMVEDTNWK